MELAALDQFKKSFIREYSKYFDDLLSDERSLPFGLLVLIYFLTFFLFFIMFFLLFFLFYFFCLFIVNIGEISKVTRKVHVSLLTCPQEQSSKC